jgi:putative membrane protein
MCRFTDSIYVTLHSDHTKANEDLRTIASEKSIETPKVLNAKDQEVLDRLEKLVGAEFDKAYVAEMNAAISS